MLVNTELALCFEKGYCAKSSYVPSLVTLRPRLHEYLFIKNDIVFNGNATTVLHLHIVFVSLSYRFRIVFISFSAVYTKTMKTIENVKTSGNPLFACQDHLNNMWLLLHRFQKFAFSVKTIHLHDNDIIITIAFSNLSTLEIVFKSCFQ